MNPAHAIVGQVPAEDAIRGTLDRALESAALSPVGPGGVASLRFLALDESSGDVESRPAAHIDPVDLHRALIGEVTWLRLAWEHRLRISMTKRFVVPILAGIPMLMSLYCDALAEPRVRPDCAFFRGLNPSRLEALLPALPDRFRATRRSDSQMLAALLLLTLEPRDQARQLRATSRSLRGTSRPNEPIAGVTAHLASLLTYELNVNADHRRIKCRFVA